MTVPNAAAFYADVGARLAGEVLCRACGRRSPVSAADAGRYLAKGWPRCCGETMQLEPAPAPNVNPPPKRPR